MAIEPNNLPADYVSVRALDLHKILRAFYASDARHTNDEMAAADRLHIRLLGLPGLREALLIDGQVPPETGARPMGQGGARQSPGTEQFDGDDRG